MPSPEFIALGYCSNDHLCRLPRIPIDGKAEMLEHQIQGGGPAAGAAVGAARLGLTCGFVSAVGDDSDGATILEDFRRENIDISGIRVRLHSLSPVAYCWITPDGGRSVAWTHNQLGLLEADEIPVSMIRQARILHLDGHHPQAALAAARVAKDAGVLISLDAGTMTSTIDELLPLADILIASESFARRWSGESELQGALRRLRQKNPTARALGCTMGAEGSLMIQNNGSTLFCPAFRGVSVVDTTGAGDAYHAGFAVESLFSQDLMHLMRFASAVAALKCGKLGARAGLPQRHEVEEFLQAHPK